MLKAILILILSSSPALAQHMHGDTEVPEPRGSFYATWLSPKFRDNEGHRQASCCNTKDCAPVTIIKEADGKFHVLGHPDALGQDLPIDDDRMEMNYDDARESPDGLSHACVFNSFVTCAVLGAGM